MFRRAAFAIALVPSFSVAQPPQTFDFDVSHSSVGFSVRFMGLSTVRGAFADFSGTLVYDAAKPERSSVTTVIRPASINTNSAMRDRDLKSENFFDAEKFPVIVFRSESARRDGDGVVLEGPLSMHGVTKTVRFPVRLLHSATKDAWRNTRIGFVGNLKINRKDFGILGTKFWNSEYDPGRMAIGDTVDVELLVEASIDNTELWTAPLADSLITRAAEQGLQPTFDQFRAAAAGNQQLASSSEMALWRAARKLLQRGKTADAIAFFKFGAEMNPKSLSTFIWLARAQLAAGDAAAARASAERAKAIDENSPGASELLRGLRG
jgi:polyisoprenoid-binding protein YceI